MQHYDFLNLAMFSGKGGVGKTTLSCSFARRWAQQFSDQRVLLISTDPAHSLGDVLLLPVDNEPRSLPGLPNLQVQALNAQALLNQFKARYGKVLELLVERGSFVEGEDLSPVWDLSFPGLDELMSILEIQRILQEGEADRVVVDMAPSGHTLNLFGLMDFLDNFLGALELFQEKHRVISQSLAGSCVEDEADDFLLEMKEKLAAGRHLLQDSAQTACLVVAIAEPMSYLETRRFLEALGTLHIPVGGVFVNRISTTAASDRAAEQAELLEKFEAIAPDLPIWIMPQQAQEPVGEVLLDALMGDVISSSSFSNPIKASSSLSPLLPAKLLPSFDDFIASGRRLIIVGGKGGVGKTTVSAAIAWGMATRHGDRPVRVLSIDPAHSLGDALGQSLTHEPINLTPNLSAQEVDAEQVLDQFRTDYLWELADMMSGDTGDDNLKLAYGPEAWRRIVAQALPGIDEMLSLITVMDLLEQGEQHLIVLDTAPTGHLLRFLEMPTAMGEWLGWIFKLWIKYQDVAGRVELMGRLRTLRQRVMKAQKKLQDPAYTEFIGVVQSQSAILAEASRLTQTLHDMGMRQQYLVHNRYEPGQDIAPALFPSQTIVRLPQLPRAIAPQAQIAIAADLLF